MGSESKTQGDIDFVFVQGLLDEHEAGYFRACLASETDENNQPLASATYSTSRVGFFMAAINLCKRLDKSKKHPFPETPAKWNIAFVNNELIVPMIEPGYLSVAENRDGTFTAHLMAPPRSSLLDPLAEKAFIEECIQKGLMNSYEDATSQSGFRALSNLFHKLDAYGSAQTIDALVLDPLAAGFFMPVALQQGE